ncbi:MAG: hypothetical protein ACTSRE_01530 [Promethearchaeota archaeon]
MQLFRITPDQEAISVRAQNLVKDNLKQDGVYLIVDDDKKIVWSYKGDKANILLQFYGGLLKEKMLKRMTATYRALDLNTFQNNSETVTGVMDAPVKVGQAPEIRTKSKSEEVSAISTKRYMTIAQSRMLETCVHQGLHAKDIIQEVAEFENPPGFQRHMSMITGSMYNEDKAVKKFITESKEETTLNKIGILPNGFYFLENMSSRLFIKDGKVACLDFMIEKNTDLGENRILVPVLHQEKIHREGDLNILLSSFKAPEK